MTVLRTERLTLRATKPEDAARFSVLCNDIAIARNTARIPHPYTMEDARKFTEDSSKHFGINNKYRFAICADEEIIGCIGVEPSDEACLELGYWIGADYWGKGVATEAATAVATFTFDALGIAKLTAGYFHDNPASGRILEKIGFRRTGKIIYIKSLARDCEMKTIRMEKTPA